MRRCIDFEELRRTAENLAMKNVLTKVNRAVLEAFARRNALLAFDFDGTLAPIVAAPTRARMRAETRRLLSALTELYHKGVLTIEQVIWKMSLRPAELIGLKNFNEIKEGSAANLTVVSLDEEWEVRKADFLSLSKNSCFIGKKFKGKVKHTICNGKLYSYDKEGVLS